MKWFELLIATIAAFAAVASAKTASTVSQLEQNRFMHEEKVRLEAMDFSERMKAIEALSAWAKGHTEAGAHCMGMLSMFSKHEFKEFAARATKQLNRDQTKFSDRCFVAYPDHFDSDGDLVLDEREFRYLVQQVVDQLNNYESLALYWTELGSSARNTICKQAVVGKSDAYREFASIADGTGWWNYPAFSDFMDKCNEVTTLSDQPS